MDFNAKIIEGFNTLLSIMGICRQKIRRYWTSNYTLDQRDLTHMCRIFPPETTEYTFKFTKNFVQDRLCIMPPKSLNKFKRIEIMYPVSFLTTMI